MRLLGLHMCPKTVRIDVFKSGSAKDKKGAKFFNIYDILICVIQK